MVKLADDMAPRATFINDPRDLCDPRGIRRPASSDFPRPLTLEVAFVVEPPSNVVNLRSRNVVLWVPGMAPFDHERTGEFADPPG